MSWKKNPLNTPIYLFLLVMSLSLIFSHHKMVSFQDYFIFVIYFFTFFLVSNSISSSGEMSEFIKIFFPISFVVSLYAILQYYHLDPYLKELPDISSTIGQRNWIANYIGMFLPLAIIYFLLENSRKNKIIYFFVLCIYYLTIMICQSRGMWLSILLTFILGCYLIYRFKFYNIFKENKKWLLALIFSFMVITASYSINMPLNQNVLTVSQRAISTFDPKDISINMHLLTWKSAFKMIKDKPIFGFGIGNFKMYYPNYQAEVIHKNPRLIKYSGKVTEAHNEYLQIWTELGIVGFGIFIGIIFIFYQIAIKFLKEEKNEARHLIFLGLILGITCFLFHCLFAYPLHVPALGSTFFVLLGLAATSTGKYEVNKINLTHHKGLKIILITSICLSSLFFIYSLVIKPYIAEIYYFMGMKYNAAEDYNRALDSYVYAVQLEPFNGGMLQALGTTYYHLGIQDKAQNILEKSKNYLNEINVYRNLGLSFMQSGQYEEAEKELIQAIYLEPKFIAAYADLAYIYAVQKEYEKAITQWNKILEIEPNFSAQYNILYYLGLTYEKKGMPDQALEYFLEALELTPEGDPIKKEIEEEINKVYKNKLDD